jgi:lysozyme family protein
MSEVEFAIVNTLRWEVDASGRHYNVDQGGPTNWGITLPLYTTFLRTANPAASPTVDDLKLMTLEGAIGAMRWYWTTGPFADVDYQILASKVYDLEFNAPPTEGWRCLQRACNDLGAGIAVDGIPGYQTLSNANSLNQGQLVLAMCSEVRAYYQAVVNKHPEWVRDATSPGGWFDRAAWKG